MGEVLQLKPCVNVVTALRNIADGIESGELEADSITLISPPDIYHLGVFDDGAAAQDAIFNMTYGIHKMMNAAMDEVD